MRRRLVHTIAVVAALAAGSARVVAHHSAAMFDEKKTITVEGEVKEFQLTNPHSWLIVNVKEKDGKVVSWGFEAEGPSTLARAGIRPSDLRPGTRLTTTWASSSPPRNAPHSSRSSCCSSAAARSSSPGCSS